MSGRVHPVKTGGVRFDFEGYLKNALWSIEHALLVAEKPIMHAFLAPIGEADTIADVREAKARIDAVLTSLDALPPIVEFRDEEG